MAINEQQRAEIIKIYKQGADIKTLFLFEQIPAKKLQNVIRSYAPSMSADEIAILLHDDTVWGSSKEGFLLTNTHLYSKGMLEKGYHTKISEINNITITHEKTSSTILVNADIVTFKIQVLLPNKNDKTIIFRVLDEMVKFLQGSPLRKAENSQAKPLQCKGCGATTDGRFVTCEYCGVPLV